MVKPSEVSPNHTFEYSNQTFLQFYRKVNDTRNLLANKEIDNEEAVKRLDQARNLVANMALPDLSFKHIETKLDRILRLIEKVES